MTNKWSAFACAMAVALMCNGPASAAKFLMWTDSIQLERDIRSGSAGSAPVWLAIYNETLYFAATGDGQGRELWRYDDGTATRVSNISPGAGDAFPNQLTAYNGALYFTANDSPLNRELWRYDGTNVALAAEILPGTAGSFPDELTVFNGALYFAAASTSSLVRQLYRYDGTTATVAPGTQQLREVQQLTVHDGQLWFLARNPNHSNTRIWRINGQSVQSVAPIDNSNSGQRPELESTGSRLYARLRHPSYGVELWRVASEGLSVIDIVPGQESSSPLKLTGYKGKLYMSARLLVPGYSDLHGRELVRLDGTEAVMVHNINTAPYGDSNPGGMTGFHDELYFAADLGHDTERELFKHDPANDTTVLLKNINPSGSSSPAWFTKGPGELLYFAADDGVHGHELWSLRRTLGRLQVVLFPKWTPEELINPWEWEVQVTAENVDAELTLAAFLLADEGPARYFQRLDMKLPRGGARSERVITGHGTGKEKGEMTLAVAVFDRQTGKLVGVETATVAIGHRLDEKQQQHHHRRATTILDKISLRSLAEFEPGSMVTAP